MCTARTHFAGDLLPRGNSAACGAPHCSAAPARVTPRPCVRVQAKLDAFRKRFPAATEHGIPASDGTRSTHPFLFASGLDAGSAQVDIENWSPALQEVALDVPATPGAPACLQQHAQHRSR